MKSGWIDYACVSVLLFFAGGATALSRSVQTLDGAIGVVVLALACLALVGRRRLFPTRRLLFLLVGFLLYYILVTAKFQSLHYKFLIYYPFAFVVAYCFVSGMGSRFFHVYERVIVALALVSMVFWTLMIVSGGAALTALRTLSPFEPYNEMVQAHVLVFTVVAEQVESFLPRNSGFAWEPGAFSVFLCLAMFCNMARVRFKLRGNWSLLALVAALITTQSTTGYSIFIVLCVLWVINVRSRLTFALMVPVACVAVIYISSLPFMLEKVQRLFGESIDDLAYTAQLSWNQDRVIHAQRVASLKIDFQDFLDNPLLGYGGHDEDMWTRQAGLNLVSISGVGKVIAKFGLVGLTFFLWALFRSSRQFAADFGYRGGWVLFVLILQIAVSYSLIENPLVMCFWLYAAFRRRSEFALPEARAVAPSLAAA